MKICHISTALYSPNILTGIEIYVRNLLRQLANNGHKASVITTSPKSPRVASVSKLDGVKVYSFYPLNIYERSESREKPLFMKLIWHGLDLLWNPHTYMVIRDILKREIPDVVHIHNFRNLSPSVFTAVKSLHIPLVLTVHDYSLICPKSSLLRSSGSLCNQPPLVCKLYKMVRGLAIDSKPDLVTANTNFMMSKQREHGLFKNVRFEKLPITTFEVQGEKITKDFEIIDILYSGQLGKFKGVNILISAFRQLRHSNIRLHIAGTGRDREEFERMAADDSRITFYGAVHWERLTELYQQANVTVVPSIFYEPYGLVILESFRDSTPVIASNIGGIPELIEHGYNGILFEPGSVVELKDALENLIENPSELKRLGEGAFESAKKYDINANIIKLQELYEQLIK